jgi:hypothetical protein
VLLVDKPGATQTYFWLGNVGASRTDPARTAQSVVNTLLGGRFTSMLNTELRIKSGLSYGASSSFTRFAQPGAFSIESYTETGKTWSALDLALATLDRLHSDGVEAAALASGKSYLLGQFPTTLETNGQLAARLTDLLLYNLGPEDVDGYATRIAAVDAAAATGDDCHGLSGRGEPGHRDDRRRDADPRRRREVRTADRDEARRSVVPAGTEGAMTSCTALLAGASGLVGGHCLRLLLASTRYERVIAVVRSRLPAEFESSAADGAGRRLSPGSVTSASVSSRTTCSVRSARPCARRARSALPRSRLRIPAQARAAAAQRGGTSISRS